MNRRCLARIILLCGLLLPAVAFPGVYENGPPQAPPQDPISHAPPDLNLVYPTDNFDWTADEYQMNPAGGYNGLEGINSPFGQLPGLLDRDYEPDDGWVLMARYFGTEEVGANPPFLILYNKYRGIVRFLVYLTDQLKDNYTYGRITLAFTDDGPSTKNLRNRSILYPLSRFEEPQDYQDVNIIKLQLGWNYADFVVGYDPAVSTLVNPTFGFDIDGVTVNTLNLGGDSQENTISMGISNLAQTPLGTLKALVANLNKAQKTYGEGQKISLAMQKWIAGLESQTHATNLMALINDDLPLPGIAAFAGFAERLIAGTKKNGQPTLTHTETHLALTGTMEADKHIMTIPLRVPGSIHDGSSLILPVWDYPLGVFAILEDPATSYLTSASTYHQDFLDNPCSECVSSLAWFKYMDVLHIDQPISYAINDEFPGHLTLRDLQAAWSFSAPHPKSEGVPTYWDVTPPVYINWMSDLLDQGRLMIIGSADLNDHNYYEYRTQYVDINSFHLYQPEVPRPFLYTEPYFSQGLGVTPPVMIKARFAVPGKPATEDIEIVESYDLWWPSDTPYGKPPGWSPPAVAPIWVEPTVPHQDVISPNGGEMIATGSPWDISWEVPGGDVEYVDIDLSGDDGQTFPLSIASHTPNTGQFTSVPVGSPGTQYRVRVTSHNQGVQYQDVSDGSFTVWGIESASITPTVGNFCDNDQAMETFTVAWNTSVATDGMDKLEIWPPGTTYPGPPKFTVTNQPGSPTAAHSLSKQMKCNEGGIIFRITSILNGGATSVLSGVSAGTCPSCGEPNINMSSATDIVTKMFLKSVAVERAGSKLRFGLPESGPVQLRVFDVQGRVVKTLVDDFMSRGVHEVRWDGRNASGNPVSSGIYFVNLKAPKGAATTKVNIVR